MKQAATQTSAPLDLGALEVVSFIAGGHRFAVEAAQVRTQLPAGQGDALVTAEQLLGLSGDDAQILTSRRILMMKHPTGDYPVSVSEPVELRTLGISTIHPLPSLIVARCTLAGIRGLAMGAEGVTVLVDFRTARTCEK